MSDPLNEARMRAQKYWYRDGLLEILLGVVSLLQGGWLLFNHLVSSNSSSFVPGALIYVLLIAAFSASVTRIIASIRERLTYPRSGYVDFGKSAQTQRYRVRVAVAIFIGTIGGAMALRYHVAGGWQADRWIHWTPAVGGVLVGALSAYVGVRHRLPRYLIVGLLSAVLGIVISGAYPLKMATAIWLSGVGCAWISSGGVALWKYVRTTPPTANET